MNIMKYDKRVILEVMLLMVALLDALYLTYHHYHINIMRPAVKSFCSINSFIDCDSVALSQYSTLMGIPVSSLGIFAYAFVLLSYVFLKNDCGEKIHLCLAGILGLMFIFSMYELWISFFILKSVCLMCCVLYFGITLLFLLFLARLRQVWSKNLVKQIFVVCLFKRKILMKIATFFNIALFLAFGADRAFAQYFEKIHNAEVFQQKQNTDQSFIKNYYALKKEAINLTNSPVMGAIDAPLTIVEFSDFQCPACAQRSLFLKSLLEKHNKKIKIYFKHYPLDQACNSDVKQPFHPFACQAAEAAVCAKEQNRFWEFHEALFRDQRDLSNDYVLTLARNLSLNVFDFTSCLTKRAGKVIALDLAEAQKLGINYTPSLYLEGRKVSDILRSANDFDILINHLLDNAEKKRGDL